MKTLINGKAVEQPRPPNELSQCTHASCRIRPETLTKAREALLKISRLHSWWGAQEIALEALEATKGTAP